MRRKNTAQLLAALLAALTLLVSGCGEKQEASDGAPDEPLMREEDLTVEPQPDAELSEMVDAIYDVQPVDLMGMETVAIDLTDESWYGYLAGLTADNVDKVDAAVVSEPMTGRKLLGVVICGIGLFFLIK